MIDIPLKAEIECSDGYAGHSTYVVINPITKLITHLVVKSNWPSNQEVMVPIDQVEETMSDFTLLKCSQDDLKKMEPFVSEEYIRTKLPDYDRWKDAYVSWPLVLSGPSYIDEEVDATIPVVHENTPLGELAVRRGAHVEATDGYVGQVDELLINSQNMHVTHLILRERHIFEGREVTVPVSQIDYVDKDKVYLKLDKKSIKDLPTVPVQRWSLQGY